MFVRKILIGLFVSLFLSCQVWAEPSADHTKASQEQHEIEFNPGSFIIDHVLDAHEWHIATVGQTHISVPLPIFLIYDGQFYAFMSSKFHHNDGVYKGFKIKQEAPRKGSIVHVEPNGEISEKKPIDLSLTKNAFSLLLSAILIFILFRSVAKAYKRKGSDKAPSGLQNLVEPVIIFVRDNIAKVALNDKAVNRYLPYLLTLFFFILLNNLMGIIPFFPGGANVTGNIAVTLVLAILTFLIVNFSGKKTYWKHIVNYPGAPWWIKFPPLPLLPIVEIMGLFTKPIVLMIRLFANITAGHIIVLGFISLIFIMGQLSPFIGYAVSPISIIFALFIDVLELLVAFIQAYIFTLLTSLYIGDAVKESH